MALENVYHVENRTVDFTFLLQALLPVINRQFKKHIVYAEGIMLSLLKTSKENLQVSDIDDLVVHLHVPIIVAYILLGGILISILAMPFICCTYSSCTKKIINTSNWTNLFCFPLEITLFVFFGIWLALGIIGLYQTTVSIQEMLMVFPLMWRNMISDLALNRYAFKMQVTSIINNIKASADLIINETSQIPTAIAGNVTNEKLNRNLNISLSYINGYPFQAEIIFNTSSFLPNQKFVTHSFEYEFETTRKKFSLLRDFLYRGNSSADEITAVVHFFAKNRKFPKWTILYSNLKIIFQKTLPKVIQSLDFKNNLLLNIQKSSRKEMMKVTRAMVTLHELASTVDHKIDMAIEVLFPKTAQDLIINQSYRVENYLSHFDMLTRNNKNLFLNGNLWIMLTPCIVVLILFLLFVYTFVFSIEEVKKIILNSAWNLNLYSSKTFKIITLFRICMTFSISILWFLLILTTMFYCAHLPVSIFCEAINDQHIFTDYVDKPNHVWNNKTWLDNKLYRFLPSYKNESRVRKILDECYLNKTLYESLGMHQYWNISRNINDLIVLMNVTTLQKMVSKAIIGMKTPDVEINNLLKILNTIENNFNLPNISDIEEIKKIFSNNLEHKLQNVIKTTIEDEKLIKLLNDVKFLKQIHFPNLLGNMSDLIYLKFYLKNMREQFESIKLIVGDLAPIIQEAPKKVNEVLQNAATKINAIITKLGSETTNQVKNKLGNCYVLPFVYDKAVWSVCHHGLSVLNAVWVSLGVICISIALCIISSCRLSGYIRGTNSNYCVWRGSTMENYRYSNQTARLNGTFLFNKSISATGNSFTMTEENVNKAN